MESFHLQIAGWNRASSQLFKSCLSESCITEAPLPPRLPLWLFTLRFFRSGSQVHWQIGRAPRGSDIQIWQFSYITKKLWMGGGGKHWLSSDFELPVGFNYRATPAQGLLSPPATAPLLLSWDTYELLLCVVSYLHGAHTLWVHGTCVIFHLSCLWCLADNTPTVSRCGWTE